MNDVQRQDEFQAQVDDTQSKVAQFIERVRNGSIGEKRAQSYLDALQYMEGSVNATGDILIAELHRVVLQWSDKTARSTLWQYPGERIKIRNAICDTYDLPAARPLP